MALGSPHVIHYDMGLIIVKKIVFQKYTTCLPIPTGIKKAVHLCDVYKIVILSSFRVEI